MATTTGTDQIDARVIEVIRGFVEEPDIEITRSSSLEALDIDSLDLAELAQIMEEDYGVAFDGDDVKKLKTVGDAADLIAARGG